MKVSNQLVAVLILVSIRAVSASAEGMSVDCFDSARSYLIQGPEGANSVHNDPVADPLVQQSLGRLGCLIQSRYFRRDAGLADRISAELLFYRELEDWLDENPEATVRQVRQKARSLVVDIAEGPIMRNPNANWHPVGELRIHSATDGSGSFLLRNDQVFGFVSSETETGNECGEVIPEYEEGLLTGFKCSPETD